MPELIFIEGIIGVGKSTLIEKLKNEGVNEFEAIQEPIGEFTLLKQFYENPKKYAYDFQLQVLEVIVNLMEKIVEKFSSSQKTIVVERSPMSCAIFTHQLSRTENGFISEQQRKFIKEKIFNNMVKMSKHFKIRFFLLDCDVAVAQRNIKSRNRAGEENIQNGYLEHLRECHVKMFPVVIENNIESLKNALCSLHVSPNFEDMLKMLHERAKK